MCKLATHTKGTISMMRPTGIPTIVIISTRASVNEARVGLWIAGGRRKTP